MLKKLKQKIKQGLKKCARKNYLFRKIYKKIEFIVKRIRYRKMYKKVSVNDKLIIFECFFAKKYADSPKAIYEYMLNNKRFKDYTFVWAFKNTKIHKHKRIGKKPNTKIVKYDTKKYYEYYAKAKYWITNTRLPDTIIKKKEQVYVQCWHGTPLKRLGYDIEFKKNNPLGKTKRVKNLYKGDAKRYTYMLSPSRFASEKFTSAFNLKKLHKENIIIEKGYPRNDFLCNYTEEDVKKQKEYLGVPLNKKVILYAPTWRDNQHELGKGYILDLKLDLNKLRQQIGDEYFILMRLHYLIANKLDLTGLEDFAMDVSNCDEINNLYIVSDMLITDYSSVFFDYANLKKPMLFYMYDLEQYKGNLRDFYIDLKELPGPIVETQEELINNIKNIKSISKSYKNKYKKFNETYNYLQDGNSTKRVVNKIISNNKK